jgi:RNA polymerase sigma-70 factor (ECF subfamily)
LRRKNPSVDIEEFERLAVSTEGNPSADTINRELGNAIKDSIRLLPEKYIPIIVLKDMEGLKYEEIAGILNISVGTVKSRISRAREKLRAILISNDLI